MMNVDSVLSKDNKVLFIGVKGKFDFSMLNEFRAAYSNDAVKDLNIIVDMRNTSTIDSSALGMLLNMQRYLNKRDGEIEIINCNQDIKKVLNITRFDKKFGVK